MTYEEDQEKIQNSRLKDSFNKGVKETAKNMKKKGIDIKTIIECTGLSLDEIKNL